jgi:hypothetical protein
MKIIVWAILVLTAGISFGKNYYVSPQGDNSNNGLTITTTFKTLNYAADITQPGDTVFVMNGTYTNANISDNVLNIFHSGTASQWITFKNYPGHTPQIKMYANNWGGISIQGSDYIIIDGFSVTGNNDSITLAYAILQKDNLNNSSTSGSGISIAREYSNPINKAHHIIVKNCRVTKCGGGGIETYQADYVTIENNVISNCGWYSPYDNSGISLYQNWNSDLSVGIKNFITGNTCYRNQNYIPFFAAGTITDGNGIIIDDSRNTQSGSTLGAYVGKTYVANNVVFDNGARGIHCYSSDNVMVVNNTSYKNCQSPSTKEGEYTAFDAGNILFVNNIAFPDAAIPPMGSNNVTNLEVDHNLWAANSSIATPFGANSITANPSFVIESSKPASANFRLQSGSTAINKGIRKDAPSKDKDGSIRSLSDSVDIGAYEYKATVDTGSTNKNSFYLFPNPAKDFIYLQMLDRNSTEAQYDIYNAVGQKLKSVNAVSINGSIWINIKDLPNGVYFIKLTPQNAKSVSTRFVKV